jgi:putative transcriptional regulator
MNLTHHFLIAMPGLEDVSFAGSVVYLCEHSERGALGLIINKPTDIKLQGLFEKVDLPLGPDLSDAPVFLGAGADRARLCAARTHAGPGRTGRESAYASTMVIPGGGLEMTTSKDVLEALAGRRPPACTGHAGLFGLGRGSAGIELAENTWLTVGADLGVIFDTPIDKRYDSALGLLGLQAWQLSPGAGRMSARRAAPKQARTAVRSTEVFQ